MDVYRELGSFERGLLIFGELDVKQIQVDTLSYLILRPSLCYGLFGEVQGQCKAIRAVHRNCSNETADHVARAVERGNYSKGAEIDRFQVGSYMCWLGVRVSFIRLVHKVRQP
ncbi:unnamed protein product [Laminaria digitata]